MIGKKPESANRVWLLVTLIVALVLAWVTQQGAAPQADQSGPCAVSSQVVAVDGELTVHKEHRPLWY